MGLICETLPVKCVEWGGWGKGVGLISNTKIKN